jgi:hypothetical protein
MNRASSNASWANFLNNQQLPLEIPRRSDLHRVTLFRNGSVADTWLLPIDQGTAKGWCRIELNQAAD